jgi:hypothetical protein
VKSSFRFCSSQCSLCKDENTKTQHVTSARNLVERGSKRYARHIQSKIAVALTLPTVPPFEAHRLF